MNWLLVRGLLREQRHWGSFPKSLTARFPHDQVFCLDLPGVGTEFDRCSPLSIELIMLDLRERWLKLRESTPGDWGLIAMSMGGMVGMQWCHQFPSDFSRLVLLSSSASNLSWPWQRLQLKNLPLILQMALERDAEQKERLTLLMTTHLYRGDPVILRAKHPIQTGLRQLWAAATYTCPDRLPIPTLVLASIADRFTSPTCSEALARHFGASLSIHHRAGHDLALDDPDWVAEQIQIWASQS